jgi:hypothetical protein
MSETMTVGKLRRVLDGFDDGATVVVSTGIGYEEPRVRLAKVRAVLVPHRYVAPGRLASSSAIERPEQTVVHLVGVNG